MSMGYGLEPRGTPGVNWPHTFQGFALYYKALWLTLLLGLGFAALVFTMFPNGDPDLFLGGVMVFNAMSMAVGVMQVIALVRFATLANRVEATRVLKIAIGISVALLAVHLLTFLRLLLDGFAALDPTYTDGLLDSIVSAATVVNYVCQLLFLKRVAALVSKESLSNTITSLLVFAGIIFVTGLLPGLGLSAIKGLLMLVAFAMFMALIRKLRNETRRFSEIDVGAF